ncbi:MAG: glycine cleavage system protein R [Myxococcales bacterium]|nr:glycine cleavage system protein R [Myxococcales bacterium]
MTDVVLTLIGPDRPGLVEAVAAIIRNHGGNWLESRMARLGGKFAGILRAELPGDRAPAALRSLADLEARGLKVIAETIAEAAAPEPSRAQDGARMELQVVGVDRPGIVREIFQLLAAAGVNVEELATDRRSAPMSGEMLFEARAVVRVPESADRVALRAALERAARDLAVDAQLQEDR